MGSRLWSEWIEKIIVSANIANVKKTMNGKLYSDNLQNKKLANWLYKLFVNFKFTFQTVFAGKQLIFIHGEKKLLKLLIVFCLPKHQLGKRV